MIFENSEDIKLIRCQNSRGEIRRLLEENREERRPYVFVTDTMQEKTIQNILVPISRLEEEVYKTEICTYLARKMHVRCTLLCANDYGSMAKRNTQKFISRFDKLSEQLGTDFSYTVVQAKKNSDGLIKEVVDRYKVFDADLIILTASREYGLDDILFGPPELHAIRDSLIPIMLINPRSDLFSLCD